MVTLSKRKCRWIFFILCMIGAILLSGCDNKKAEKAVDGIKDASKAAAELTSGEFVFTYQIDDGEEDAKMANQKVVGTFEVKKNQKVNWTRKVYIADENTPRAEQKQENGVQYLKTKETNEWIKINENAVLYPPDMDSIIKIDWKAENVKKAEITVEDGSTVYVLEFNEEFLKKLKQNEVSSVEKELERAKKDSNFDEEYLKGLEDSIKAYKAINYKAYNVEALKGDRGELVSMKTQVTTVDTSVEGGRESTVTTKVRLENYDYKSLQQ